MLFPQKGVNAFLPPEFFVQGLTSLWVILAGGIAVVLSPFLVAIKSIKKYFSKYKKLIIFLIIQNIILGIFVSFFFYYNIYQPLYYQSNLFSQDVERRDELDLDLAEIASLNSSYVIVNGVLRDQDNDRKSVDDIFGLSLNTIEGMIKNNEKLLFLDIREVEEYRAGHIKDALQYRGMDLNLVVIKSLFGLSDEGFQETTIVLVCHDGGRGKIQARRLSSKNIKFIEGGMQSIGEGSETIELTGPSIPDYEIFGEKYQNNYQMKAEMLLDLIRNKDKILIIDGRHKVYYDRGHIDGSIQLNIGRMTQFEYDKALRRILENKDSQLIVICNRYGELFHANLLFLRLEKNYNFDDSRFNIVFNQFDIIENSEEVSLVK